MKAKNTSKISSSGVDANALTAVGKIVEKFVKDNPRLKLSGNESEVMDSAFSIDSSDVADVYRKGLGLADSN
jgi:hypothetical protein